MRLHLRALPALVLAPGSEGALERIHETKFHALFRDDARGLFVFVRSRAAHPTADSLYRDATAAMIIALDQAPEYGLVMDSRKAVGRNDPAFEAVMDQVHRESLSRFARLVFLMRSATGVLQSERKTQKSRYVTSTLLITRSEEEAFAFAATRDGGDALHSRAEAPSET